MLAELPPRARQLMDIAVTAQPNQIELRIDRAMALAALDDYNGARQDLDVALSLDPTRDDASALRAAARRHLKDNAGAMADVSTALALDDRSPEHRRSQASRGGNASCPHGERPVVARL